ncbi:MAG: PrgI family protein, partial [Candidatus Diapherotrites archaeon]
MSYEIPQNLRYQEKIAFNLSFKQMIWLGLFGIIDWIIFIKTPFIFEVKIIAMIVFGLIAIGFAFFNLLEHLKSALSFVFSFKPRGYFDPKLNAFLKVKKIDSDTVFLKTKKALAIIQIHPINFSILSKEQQNAIILSFKDFLNSLDFPIQIVM